MMDVFKKMWPDAWGVRMEHILRNVLMALLEQPDATLHEVLRIFSDKEVGKPSMSPGRFLLITLPRITNTRRGLVGHFASLASDSRRGRHVIASSVARPRRAPNTEDDARVR